MTAKTETYRQHHAEIRALADRIDQALVLPAITADPHPIAAIVRELFGKYGVHLAIEDSALYPRMAVHDDARVRHTAGRFQHEMGDLKVRFDAYRNRWPGPGAIARDPAAFMAETTEVLRSLRHRIAREDKELYDLYDAAA